MSYDYTMEWYGTVKKSLREEFSKIMDNHEGCLDVMAKDNPCIFEYLMGMTYDEDTGVIFPVEPSLSWGGEEKEMMFASWISSYIEPCDMLFFDLEGGITGYRFDDEGRYIKLKANIVPADFHEEMLHSLRSLADRNNNVVFLPRKLARAINDVLDEKNQEQEHEPVHIGKMLKYLADMME